MSRSVHDGFTERLKLALDEAGYTGYKQKQLGELFGISGQAVMKWLRGESIPNAERAPQVAEKLGVRRAWLLDNELPMRVLQGAIVEEGEGYAAQGGLSLSGSEFKVVTLFRQLPHEQQEIVTALLAGMVSMRTKK